MKKIYCLFIMILALGLTGCSFGSSDKNGTDKKEKKATPIVEYDPLEYDTTLFDWVGSFKNNESNFTMDVYVFANGNSLDFEFNIPGNVFSDTSEDEIDGGQSIAFSVEEINGSEIEVDDEFLGLKGTIKKTENGYDADLVMGDAHEMISLSGKYDKVETKGGLKGYFADGDYKLFAITPLAETVKVSYVTVVDGFYNSSDLGCDYISDDKVVCEDDDITIIKTEKGIKVDTKDKNIKGEYEAK